MTDHWWLLAIAFASTTVGMLAYSRFARHVGILAVPNERTLHARPTVRGGGVIVALITLAGLTWLYADGELSGRFAFALIGGGIAISALGFVDDIIHLSTGVRIALHTALGIFAVKLVGTPLGGGIAGEAATVLAVVWMINLFNFMDGIDGMAASGVVFFCGATIALLGASAPQALPLALLGCSSVGFLVFNWPPARLFMGDSGSGFYGYIFAVFALISTTSGSLSVWTWLIVLAYFVGDTTTTTLIRAATVPRFWGTHRSHAYQNLARVWNDHRKVTSLVIAVNLFWMFPLALAATRWPRAEIAFAACAIAPVVGFALRFGPLYDH